MSLTYQNVLCSAAALGILVVTGLSVVAVVMVPAGVFWRLTSARRVERAAAIPTAAASVKDAHQAGAPVR